MLLAHSSSVRMLNPYFRAVAIAHLTKGIYTEGVYIMHMQPRFILNWICASHS
jgi:hypothetical protein